MKKFLFPLMLATIVNFAGKAQVKGIVVDTDGKPIEMADVVLHSADSTIIGGYISNSNGEFKIKTKNALGQNCFLTISHVGYESKVYNLYNIAEHFNIGTIILQLSTTQLDAAKVTAPHSIIKTDRRIFFPPANVVENSANGYDMLNQLMMPGLKVDIVQKTIEKVGGGNVLLTINDKKASKADIITLLPDEVVSVEYVDEPGVQYANDNISAVINFIVKRRYSGIAAGINTTNATTTGYGNNFAFTKFNYKLSEFGLSYSMDYGHVKKRTIDQKDEYIMPDNTKDLINREGINTRLKYMQHDVELTYNLSKPDKYIFEADLYGVFYDSPDRGHRQKVNETGKQTYYTFTAPTEKYHRPSLDLYYKIYLPNEQKFTADVVGTYIDTKNGQSYNEYKQDDFKNPYKNYTYYTDGKKYSLISEMRYSKRFEKFTFLVGLNHAQAYTKNEYTGTSDAVNEMTTANSYLYSQIQGNLIGFNCVAGIGLSRQYYSQDDDNYTYWLLRPSLILSRNLFKNVKLRYRFYIAPNIPSLSDLSNVTQQANNLDIRIGNPNLKPYSSIGNKITLAYESETFNVETSVSHDYSRKVIMEDINRVTNKTKDTTFFIFGYENQKRLETLSNYTSVEYYIIPGKLNVQGDLTISHIKSVGNNYTHSLNYVQGGIQANAYLGNFNIGAGYKSREKSLSGETVSYASKYSILYINYNIKNMIMLGVSWSYIMHNSDMVDKIKNKYVYKELDVNVPAFKNMISLSLSINFNKGRQYEHKGNNINNKDTDSGAFKY